MRQPACLASAGGNPEGHFVSRLIADEVRSTPSKHKGLQFEVQIHAVTAQPRVLSRPHDCPRRPVQSVLFGGEPFLFTVCPHPRSIISSYPPVAEFALGRSFYSSFPERSVRSEPVTCMFSEEPYVVAAKSR